ncbi:ras-related protein Rab-26-like [Oncorhynchus clarkii lewisi]|uniref:ras-related protein Rab-26-like n=1 Tax=Oncorhynchus clarkii lewisi TaxID=490388 RepID=UPI0039B87246
MSRKKAGKGKNANSSPTTGIPTGNQKGETGKSTAGTGSVVQANGMVHPSRPSLSNSSEFYDIAFKVMLVGDSGVGKTCLLVRFKDGAFLAGSFISTVGIDFRNKVMNIDRLKVKLQIWDTAGQERFRSVTHAYYRDANALLLLYDVTNRTSFDNIKCQESRLKSISSEVHVPTSVCQLLFGPQPFGLQTNGTPQVSRDSSEVSRGPWGYPGAMGLPSSLKYVTEFPLIYGGRVLSKRHVEIDVEETVDRKLFEK